MVDYTVTESFYDGAETSLSPDYGGFMGFRMNAAQLGFPGSPQTANQLGETVNALKQGVKAFEVSLLIPDTAEAIPKQHFNEMRALMKLSGVKPSMHGPMVDAAGWGEKGWNGDYGREDSERRMFDAIEKAHMLDPNGNVPIVFHGSSGVPGSEIKPGKDGVIVEKQFAINQETKQMAPLELEYKYRPEHPELLEGKGKEYTPEKELDSINATEWENKMTELATFAKHSDEIIGSSALYLRKKGYENGVVTSEGIKDSVTGEMLPFLDDHQREKYYQMKKADIFLDNIQMNFAGAFHKAFKYGSDEQKEELKKLSQGYNEEIKKLPENAVFNPIHKKEIFENAIGALQKITSQRKLVENGSYVVKDGHYVDDENYGAPKIYQEVESFAMDKSAKTFGNLAMQSYEKFGDNAPIIAIENFQPGSAFSSAKKLKELVEISRKNFVKQLVEEKGLSKSEAKEIAEKQLGVTWDVGHLNMIKKKGFTDKDVMAETELITKDKTMVKHVHLTDNFGFADSHLAPGMGNVPFKKVMEQLERTGRLDEMNKIVEAGGFVQHFKKSPHGLTLAAFGSPIYGMKSAPYWNQVADMQGAYFGGYGTLNPSQHHTMYGAGFTNMPVELGGQMPGGQSRFGGTPMA
ncbi:MAG: sugar phosphate isomerase/epimerase [Nanoarchaeota archaeon]|nr:sugar phosphate isomerase/epimerase [Nanoarchaeota archaeon]